MFISQETMGWGFWSGKQDLMGALPLSSDVWYQEVLFPDEFLRMAGCDPRRAFFLWIEPKGWVGVGDVPLPGLRSCLCFPALPLMVFCGERCCVCSPDKEGFVLGCGAYKGLLGRELEARGHCGGGRGCVPGYRPPQPASEMPLGGVKEASRHLKILPQASQS